MHPSLRHYAIRIDRDEALARAVPAHRTYRSVRLEARRLPDGHQSFGARIRAAFA